MLKTIVLVFQLGTHVIIYEIKATSTRAGFEKFWSDEMWVYDANWGEFARYVVCSVLKIVKPFVQKDQIAVPVNHRACEWTHKINKLLAIDKNLVCPVSLPNISGTHTSCPTLYQRWKRLLGAYYFDSLH